MPQSAIFSIFDNAGDRLAMTYNSLTMNNPASDPNDRIEINRIRPRIPTRAVVDDRQHSDGSEAQGAFKTSLMLEMTGRILAPSRAELFDACRDLAAAFDPALITRETAPTSSLAPGFLAFDGSAPTDDTVTYPTGLILKRIHLRAMEPVVPVVLTGGNLRGQVGPSEAYFQVHLMARDPRVYSQTLSQHTPITTNNVISNATADYPSWPTLVMTCASTAGSSVSFDNTHTQFRGAALVVDLSGIDDDQVVIDMEKHEIKVNSILAMDRYVSGDWFEMYPGSNTITVSSVTGLSSTTINWRPALAY